MSDPKCIFCKIVDKKTSADIKYEDDEIVVFSDIYPVAKHHYLAIPKKHIRNVGWLTGKDRPLLDLLIDKGKQVVINEGGDVEDLKMGFHLPPFNTVGHLHLHFISPASTLGWKHRSMFKQGSFWYSDVEPIRHRLLQEEQAFNCNKL